MSPDFVWEDHYRAHREWTDAYTAYRRRTDTRSEWIVLNNCWTTATSTSSSTTLSYVWVDQTTATTLDTSWRIVNSGWTSGSNFVPRRPEAALPGADHQAAEERSAARERRREAEERANELLVSCLNDEQRQELAEHDRFVVTAPSGRRYLITRGMAGNVFEGNQRFCIHASSALPTADHMLGQKLMIETDEAGFLAIANASPAQPWEQTETAVA